MAIGRLIRCLRRLFGTDGNKDLFREAQLRPLPEGWGKVFPEGPAVVDNVPPWFLFRLDEKQFKLQRPFSRSTYRPFDREWYEMVDVGEEISLDDMVRIETRRFEETYCGNPKEGPALECAQEHGYDFILFGDSSCRPAGMVFNHMHTQATFFRRKRNG